MKKRAFFIALVLVMLFGLVACNSNSKDNSNLVKDFGNQNWIWIGPRTKEGSLTADGYYFRDAKGKLRYADLTGKGDIVLCSKVGCTHNHTDCEAHIMTSSASLMFFWKDHLYYEDSFTNSLCRRDATGGKLVEIGKMGEKYVETKYKDEDVSWRITSYIHAGEYMYYCVQLKIRKLVDENNPNEHNVVSTGSFIGRIRLDTGKDEVLAEQVSEKSGAEFSICAANEGSVLFISSNGVDTPPEDPSFVEAHRQMPVTLNCWSEDTGEIAKLFTKKREEFFEIQLIADGKLFYTSQAKNEYKGDLYAYDLKTGTEELVSENAFFYQYGGGYARRKVNDEEGYLLYNLKTGEVLPHEIKGGLPTVHGCTDEGCVLRNDITEVVKKEDGTEEVIEKLVFYYVSYASMADGLQESDFIPLYAWKMGTY